MTYQSPPRRLAPASGSFRDGVVRAAGAALHAPRLSAADAQLLHDLRRNDGRYSFRALDRLLDLLAMLPSESEALAWVADLQSAIVARRQRHQLPTDLVRAVEEEALAEAASDPLQIAVALHPPTPDLLHRTMCATRRHRDAIDTLLAALGVARVKLAQGAH